MRKELKELRLEIDYIYLTTEELKMENGSAFELKTSEGPQMVGHSNSDQVKDCCRSLLLAKAWAGSFLGMLGEDNPYKNNGSRSNVEDIEPTDSRVEYYAPQEWKTKNYIEKVDSLREHIKTLATKIVERDEMSNIFGNNVYTHLCEARFHLGFELSRIKDAEEVKVPELI